MDRSSKLEFWVISSLLALTVLLLLLQRFALDTTLVIDSSTTLPLYTSDDHGNGGQSIATLVRSEEGLILDCQIIASEYAWPYCELSIDLTAANPNTTRTGLDLSRYDRVGLWIRYEKDRQLGIRYQMRNFNEKYSLPDGGNDTLKYNSVEFYGYKSTYPVWVPMSSFQVATWWLVQNNIALEDMAPEFNDVFLLEIATASGIRPGNYRLIIERIEYQGKLIGPEALYLLLTSLWVLAAAIYVARRIYLSQQELRASRFRQRELESINRILNVKSMELEHRASRDPLTGVLNRDGLKKIFYEQLNNAGPDIGLCIIFMDIDHFKPINDNHGHLTGDNILREFAHLISNSTRDSDLLARWGGEEFILACPNCDLARATNLAEKLRDIVEQHPWPEQIKLTCSFGVAQMEKESTLEFINRADAALYSAKAQGRNRVVAAEPK